MMMRLVRPLRNALTIAAFAASAMLWTQAQADVVGAYSSASQYNLKVTYMPDLDQRRTSASGLVGLPNGGNYYCVPTSSMNLFAYAANHGFPNLPPGPAWWQSQTKYNDAGASILLLGSFMGTDPFNGTSAGNAGFGGLIWTAPYHLTYSELHASGGYSPTITDAAQALVSGGIVAICYGRYTYLGQSGNTMLVGPRNGGHCVTLSQATRSGSQIIIKVRDPADEPDSNSNDSWKFDQSPFTDKVYNNAKQLTVTSVAPLFTRTMTSLVNPPTANTAGVPYARLIDSVFIVKPQIGYSWQPGINNNPPKIKINMPQSLAGGLINPNTLFEIAGMFNANDLAISEDTGHAFVVGMSAAGGTLLKCIDTTNGETVDIAPIPGAKKIVLGRKRGLYVLTNENLYCLSTNEPDFDDPVTAQIPVPGVCNAICYDDAKDELVLLCPSQHKIFRYPASLPAGVGPDIVCIPDNILLEGDGSVMVNPVDGKAWFITDGTSNIYHVPFDDRCQPQVEMISMGAIVRPRSLSFDDMGHMFVPCDAGLKELMFNERLNRWDLLPAGYFDGFDPGPKFFVSRSRTNFDPAVHTPDAWYDVDPAEEQNLPGTESHPDCLADIVNSDTLLPPGDGKVNGADLAILLDAWGPNPGALGDIVTTSTVAPPNDGKVDGADLAYVLNAWGACP